MIRRLVSRTILSATLALALVGCAAGTPDDRGGGGGKTDDTGDTGDGTGSGQGPAGDCPSDAELIAEARAQLVADEPEFFAGFEFSDEIAAVESVGDLNGDGLDDASVAPGRAYSGPNTEQTLYLSDADSGGCPIQYVGHFGVSDLVAADDGASSNGVRDVIGTNVSACEAELTRYAFDGERYAARETTTEKLCE